MARTKATAKKNLHAVKPLLKAYTATKTRTPANGGVKKPRR